MKNGNVRATMASIYAIAGASFTKSLSSPG